VKRRSRDLSSVCVVLRDDRGERLAELIVAILGKGCRVRSPVVANSVDLIQMVALAPLLGAMMLLATTPAATKASANKKTVLWNSGT